MSDAHRKPGCVDRSPLRPDRIRQTERGFAFIPNRFLHEGFFSSLSHAERSLYLFLVLAGDRNGISFYAYDRICSTIGLIPDEYLKARDSLIDKDLIALDGSRFQVLSLPSKPIAHPRAPAPRRQESADRAPVTIGHLLRSSFQGR